MPVVPVVTLPWEFFSNNHFQTCSGWIYYIFSQIDHQWCYKYGYIKRNQIRPYIYVIFS